MNLTPHESQVVDLLRQRKVAPYAELARQLEVSPKTIQRALRKVGAYASLNRNSAYVERILGDLSHLDTKLAQAGQTAPPWTLWWGRQKPLQTGRLPRRLLRQDNLIDKLVIAYDQECRPEDTNAA